MAVRIQSELRIILFNTTTAAQGADVLNEYNNNKKKKMTNHVPNFVVIFIKSVGFENGGILVSIMHGYQPNKQICRFDDSIE